MPITIALLGSGLFAQHSYLPAILKSKEVDLHTVWSRSESSAQSLVDKFRQGGAEPACAFGDDGYTALMANADIKAVLVVLPISMQPRIAHDALKADKHVMTEKPIAKDVKTAREMIEIYEKEYKPKGLIWRVAESFAHQPILHWAHEQLKRPEMGPVLHWQLVGGGSIADESRDQATLWRTVPDYQGGFLLDGGVHQTAMLRVVLPELPATVIGGSFLHRKHLPPHDSITALCLPPRSALVGAHGESTKVQGVADMSVIPTSIGQSGPSGTVNISFGNPDLPNRPHGPPGLSITTLHGKVEVYMQWRVEVIGAKGSGVVDETRTEGWIGVPTEIDMFARAAAGKGGEPNWGEPRGALWDLAMIEAVLTSEGREVDLQRLTGSGGSGA